MSLQFYAVWLVCGCLWAVIGSHCSAETAPDDRTGRRSSRTGKMATYGGGDGGLDALRVCPSPLHIALHREKICTFRATAGRLVADVFNLPQVFIFRKWEKRPLKL